MKNFVKKYTKEIILFILINISICTINYLFYIQYSNKNLTELKEIKQKINSIESNTDDIYMDVQGNWDFLHKINDNLFYIKSDTSDIYDIFY